VVCSYHCRRSHHFNIESHVVWLHPYLLSGLHAAGTVAFDVLTQLVIADLQQQQKQTVASKQSKQVAAKTKTKQSATPAASKRPALPVASDRTKQRVLGTAATAKKAAAHSGGKTSVSHSQSRSHHRVPGKLKDGSKVKGCKGTARQGTSLACSQHCTLFAGRKRKLQPTTVGIKVPGKRPVQVRQKGLLLLMFGISLQLL